MPYTNVCIHACMSAYVLIENSLENHKEVTNGVTLLDALTQNIGFIVVPVSLTTVVLSLRCIRLTEEEEEE